MATVELLGEHRFLIEEVSWEAYEALLKGWESRSKRMTYDRGSLEFMSPLLAHEQYGTLLGRLVVFFAVERKIPLHSGRMLTIRRESMQRGLEPDDCYWIQNEPSMRSRKEFDAESDPPPDLAIEVDITSSSLDRMSIYATLGIPEVWRFDGQTFSINVLRESTYESCDSGLALPQLTREVVSRFLRLSDQMGETEWILAFLEWVKGETAGRKPRRPRKK